MSCSNRKLDQIKVFKLITVAGSDQRELVIYIRKIRHELQYKHLNLNSAINRLNRTLIIVSKNQLPKNFLVMKEKDIKLSHTSIL